MGKPKIDGLRERIAANMPTMSRPKWTDRIPPDVMAVLTAYRADFHANKLGKVTRSGLATGIVKTLADDYGIQVCDTTVERWLTRT